MPELRKGLTPHYDRDGITIYLADCRKVLPTFRDNTIDFIFSDPPYGHNNNGDLIHRWEAALGRGPHGKSREIANDDAKQSTNDLIRWSFAEWKRLLKPGACCCCCGGGGPDPQFGRWSLWLDELLGFKMMVVWDKGPMGMGWHYRRSYETVLVGEKPGAACKWYDDSNAVENVIRPGKVRKIIPQENEHPTKKPEALPARFIALHTLPGETVLDPFCGEGSTLAAAKLLGRKAVGIELEERWVAKAIKRLESIERPSEAVARIRAESSIERAEHA